MYRKISSILDGDFVLLGILRVFSRDSFDQFPVFVLKLRFFGDAFLGEFEFIIFLKILCHVCKGSYIVLLIFLMKGLYYKLMKK